MPRRADSLAAANAAAAERPRPTSGHQPPAAPSPNLKASLINGAPPLSRSHSDVS